MNDDQTPDAPQGAGADQLDDTQPVDVTRYAPAPDPRPDARWAWAAPTGQATSDRWYEPNPAAGQAPYGTPPSWGQPATGGSGTPPPPAYGTETVQPAPQPRKRGGAGAGTVVAAALLSAVLASGGTVVALQRAGAFDQPAPASNPSVAQPIAGQQPVTIDESSAVIGAAERVGPAVVKISTNGRHHPGPVRRDSEQRGLRRHLRRRRLDPHQPPRRRRQ